MITSSTGAGDTRTRLLSAGIALIAEQGFTSATVGEIEAAVGLAPRRGALYKHFPSKQALVEAAIGERMAVIADLSPVVTWLDSPEAHADRHASLVQVAAIILDELDKEKHISQIIEKEGDRFPDLRDRMRTMMVEPGYRYTEQVFTAWIERFGVDGDRPVDVAALSAVMLGALVHHRRQEWLLGAPPNNVESARFLETWAAATLAALNLAPAADYSHPASEETP